MRPIAHLLSVMLAAVTTPSLAPPTPGPIGIAQPSRVLRTRFDADRVYVIVRARNGAALELYTDTGGGMLISADAARRAGLSVRRPPDSAAAAEFGPGARIADPPALAAGEPAPPFPGTVPMAVVTNVSEIPGWPAQGDGIVGQAWFAGHVWTWDYPAHTLTLRPNGWHPATGHSTPLGFHLALGRRDLNFPRVVVRVDGAALSLLLDTGAETFLSPAALAAVHDGGPAFRAASMIAHTVFERWHAAHPDWPVIDSAQVVTHSRMIRVPHLEIAGIAVGPVWFTERSDANFHTFMSAMTDARVDGSLGGNALAGLAMTLDYPDAEAWFSCERACGPALPGR